jgi:hypothetical protein
MQDRRFEIQAGDDRVDEQLRDRPNTPPRRSVWSFTLDDWSP